MGKNDLHPNCRYWLASYDHPTVRLEDGCHNSPEGVAEAAKLHKRIFGAEGPWIMVELHPLPDMDVPINEESAEICAQLVQRHRRSGAEPVSQDPALVKIEGEERS
jgi:hypothetical protein